MRTVPRSLAIALLLLATSLTSGCARPGDAEAVGRIGGGIPPSSSVARFEVVSLTILPASDPDRATLYEDDGGALVRYTVRQPADAERAETAFVTYLLEGRIMDAQQVKLAPGEERSFERRIAPFAGGQTLHVEVRVGGAIARAEAPVLAWPRARLDALLLGPVTIRADYGLLEQDGRVIANLSLALAADAPALRDFRVKMLCVDDEGEVDLTPSVRLPLPPPGEAGAQDVSVEACRATRYGLEFKMDAPEGELVGRLLFVPRGWSPSTQA